MKTKFKNKALNWVDHRLPILSFLKDHLADKPEPNNLNYMWNFGSLAGIMLVIMIVTGIFLAMNYTPHVNHAFSSVEMIMRDINYGWLIRYAHMNGASMFFMIVYLHISRGIYYGSYKNPRELLWIIGVVIFLLMMATAFMGYVLPWGQMSFWGATVITNLFSAIPFVGESIVTWLWGGFSVDNPTLNRFFVLHYLVPFLIVGVVLIHLIALSTHGSNNPEGKEPLKKDKIPFHPYYTAKDFFGFGIFFIIYASFIFFAPNFFGEPDNYIPANPLVTPPHIVPEWYFLPFYAILRSVPSKLGGVILMIGAILIWTVLPWLDTLNVRSARYRPLFRILFFGWIASCFVLGWCGMHAPDGIYLWAGRVATLYYFAFFLSLPLIGKLELKFFPETLKKGMFMLALLFPITSFANAPEVKAQKWSFNGPFGLFDRASLQRGFQVYKEVCAPCHGLGFLSFQDLEALGFNESQIKALASQVEIKDGPNDEGKMFTRQGKPSDNFPSPFDNEKAARFANNGAYPPDLSLIVKARKGGADYIYNLLTGYTPPPKNVTIAQGMYYNEAFPGHQIAMAPPLRDDSVKYADGTKATVDQLAKDIATFLAFVSEPEMEERKRLGLKVLIFLIFLTSLFWGVKRSIWANIQHKDKE
jgi:ubiquinol-cytochrome c reductase cytochrome b/c1 subunit